MTLTAKDRELKAEPEILPLILVDIRYTSGQTKTYSVTQDFMDHWKLSHSGWVQTDQFLHGLKQVIFINLDRIEEIIVTGDDPARPVAS